MRKVLFVATVVKTHIMEFHIPYLKMFKEIGWETAVAAKNDYENPNDLIIPYCDMYYNIPFERNPLSPRNLRAYKNLKKIIDCGEFEIVHCHTPVGAMLTRLAAKRVRKRGTKVIYTAHGFHFFKGAPAVNWLLYYPVEKWLARYTDVLITINKEDYERAKNFRAGKVYYVPGVGIDLKQFNVGYMDKDKRRKEIGVHTDDFVLLSVGKLIPQNNHEVVIQALSFLKQEDRLEHLEYIICGQGAYECELRKMAVKLGVEKHIHFLANRTDIAEICNCSDAFVAMSQQEKLPIALMEAMACGLPIICSNTRGKTNLIINMRTGIVVNNEPEDVARTIERIRKNSTLRGQLSSAALRWLKQFDFSDVEVEKGKSYLIENLVLQKICSGQRIRKEFGIPLDAKVILSVGEVNKNKNHKVGIEALAKLKDKKIYYVICGNGPMIDVHKKLALRMGVGDRVIFAGYRTDVIDFYKMADIFLFPSLREGLSVAVMEAMASGLPILCSDIRGNRELIIDENYRFAPLNVESVREKIEMVLKNSRLDEVGQRNLEYVRNFDKLIVQRDMKKIYGIMD